MSNLSTYGAHAYMIYTVVMFRPFYFSVYVLARDLNHPSEMPACVLPELGATEPGETWRG